MNRVLGGSRTSGFSSTSTPTPCISCLAVLYFLVSKLGNLSFSKWKKRKVWKLPVACQAEAEAVWRGYWALTPSASDTQWRPLVSYWSGHQNPQLELWLADAMNRKTSHLVFHSVLDISWEYHTHLSLCCLSNQRQWTQEPQYSTGFQLNCQLVTKDLVPVNHEEVHEYLSGGCCFGGSHTTGFLLC